MEAGAAPLPPDQPEAAVPPPLGEQDAAERGSAPRAALEEQAKAVPAALRIDEEVPSPVTLMTEFTALSGPLPPPEMLAQYEEVLPGAADRALDGEELRLTHQREMSGIVAGAGVVFGVLVTAVILAFLGATTPAAWLGGTSLAALAGVFVYGVRQGDVRGEEDTQSENND